MPFKRLKKSLQLIFLLTAIVFGTSCSGGATGEDGALGAIVEAGNPPKPRALVGTVFAASGTSCLADGVEVYDTGDTVLTAAVNATSCEFSLEPMSDKAWGIRLYSGTSLIAILAFANDSSGETSPFYFTGTSDDELDLGGITTQSGVGYPENEPSLQSDRDADNVLDYYDINDDGDLVLDVDETDCDGDGVLDDDDLASEC